MFDWTKLTRDPTDKACSEQMASFLKSRIRYYGTSRSDFLRDCFRGKRVLDIGAGEHDSSFYNEEKWEHGVISKVASYAMAAEMHQDLCDFYNQKGFNFRCVDATSDTDLGERFERVFIGDVIEHVNNPIALLEFARRHLGNGEGSIIVSTPNPFALSWFFARLRKQRNRPFYIANFEHVSWITPTNANEIARRAGLKLVAIYFPKQKMSEAKRFKDVSRAMTSAILEKLGLIELSHKEYIYEFTR